MKSVRSLTELVKQIVSLLSTAVRQVFRVVTRHLTTITRLYRNTLGRQAHLPDSHAAAERQPKFQVQDVDGSFSSEWRGDDRVITRRKAPQTRSCVKRSTDKVSLGVRALAAPLQIFRNDPAISEVIEAGDSPPISFRAAISLREAL